MDCREYQEDMTAYMDGELTAARAAQINAHVQHCGRCNDELESLKESALFLEGNTRELEVNPLLWRNVKAQITAAARPAPRPGLLQLLLVNRWAAGAVTVAAALALALGGWSYYERRADEQRLREYMNEYVHARQMQEIQQRQRPFRSTGATDGMIPDYMDNPFVTVRPVSFENPFRSEER